MRVSLMAPSCPVFWVHLNVGGGTTIASTVLVFWDLIVGIMNIVISKAQQVSSPGAFQFRGQPRALES
jgi:hypothetical protein